MVTRKHCRKKNRRKPKLESYSYVPVCMHQVCLYYSSRVVVPLIMPVCASQQHRHYVERQPALYTPHTAILVNPIPSVPSVSTGTIAGNRHYRRTTWRSVTCPMWAVFAFRDSTFRQAGSGTPYLENKSRAVRLPTPVVRQNSQNSSKQTNKRTNEQKRTKKQKKKWKPKTHPPSLKLAPSFR